MSTRWVGQREVLRNERKDSSGVQRTGDRIDANTSL